MDEAPQLVLESLTLAFKGLQILNGIDLQLRQGELLALIGPNGAGKTSVMNCISGIYTPTGGRVLFEGANIAGLPSHKIAGLGIARTFQHVELFPHMGVIDNLLVGRHIKMTTHALHGGLFWGRTRREEIAQRAKVEEIIEFVELERYREQLAANLSFGVQKLVGFARALAMEPRILLLDEPSAGMNREEKEDLARFILRIKHESGISMIWVEHDMQMVADLADRIYVLNYGEYVTQGTPEQVLSDPKVEEVYLGTTAPTATT